MIVDPDFLDHWRTRMLVDLLEGDEMAPIYVLRIWAHCQSRRATSFEMSSVGLKALCRCGRPAEQLEAALTEAGFIARDSAAVSVPKWADHNAKLIANWRNGSTGGRPKGQDGEPNENPDESQPEPTANQNPTHPEPIRGEERREDKTPTTAIAVVVGSAAALPDCPHQELIALYHEILPVGTKVRVWNGARAKQLQARWREDKKRQSLTWWRRFFAYCAESEFLTGQTMPARDRSPFVISLDWLVKAENFAKVIEGKYHSRAAA